ncbi:MAG: hypothetical protein J6D07_06835 [Mogibacterium sp.]|nr:hypothetical protein [Mogibacterium sp.]
MDIKYSIFDPTGNITALVETRVANAEQPAIADEIMKAHPQVEQVGFVYFVPGRPVPALLRMAGGEFCGNATMSAAVLYLMRSGEETDNVRVNVSGVSRPIEVSLKAKDDGSYDAGVQMPDALEISIQKLRSNVADASMTVVRMEGISHIVIERFSGLYSLKDDKQAAEQLVRDWCSELGADCLGLMFLEGDGTSWKLTPLVYVPGADTMFWENSCASGTAAVGMYMASKLEEAVDMTINEPAGTMRVSSDPEARETIIYGNTKIICDN